MTTPLQLSWEVFGDPITDDFSPDESSPRELWDRWLPEYGQAGPVHISWFVTGANTLESAPFRSRPAVDEDFLTFYTWPVNARTGERLNWVRLPVQDKLWHGARADKGGFIQQLTGWKPSPFQPHFHAEEIAKLAGLDAALQSAEPGTVPG